MLMALVPMLPAVLLFHRYSPDRVKAARASKRRTPLEYANALVRPLSKLVQPLLMGLIALRWAGHAPMQAAALMAGIVGLSALAALLGRLTRTSRTLLGLFLFGLYISLNAPDLPVVDAVGFNGVANVNSVTMYLAFAITATSIGFVYNRQQSR